MKKTMFRRLLGVAACAVMLVTLLTAPAAVNAEETVQGGYLHRANSYDWNDGYLKDVLVFASEDASASANTIMGDETFTWWYGLVLEYNVETGAFVVTVSDMDPSDGVNQAEAATLGSGRIAVIFHSGVADAQPGSFEYFTTHAEVGTEYYLVGDYDAIVASADSITDTYLTTEKPDAYWTNPNLVVPKTEPATETSAVGGHLHRANSYDWYTSYLQDIVVFASDNASASVNSIMGSDGSFEWQYGIVLEYNEEKGTFVVTLADMDTTDGVNAAEPATLGYGKLAVIFHSAVADAQPESFEYFTTHAEIGTEYYLVGDYDAILAASGALTTDMYLTTEKPETYWTKDGIIPTEPTPEPTPEIESHCGLLTRSNSYDWNNGYLKDIHVFASEDDEFSVSTMMGEGTFAWQYSLVLEYNEEKGTFVVIASDMDPTDGINECETMKLGYGKIAIIFHGDVKEKQAESFHYFTTHSEVGTEYYLVGDYETILMTYDKLADTSLTTEKPDSYWTKPEPTPTPDPTETPVPTPTQAPQATSANGVKPVVVAVVIVAVIAAAGVVFVVIKKRK